MWGPRSTQDFRRGPDDKTKAPLVLCPCPGTDLTRPVWDWSQGLEGVKIVDSEDPALPPGLWWSALGHLCLRCVLFANIIWFSSLLPLAIFFPWIVYIKLYFLKLLSIKSSVYAMPPGPNYCFVFSFSHLYFPSPVLLLNISLFGTLIPAGSGQGRKRGNFLRNGH